MPRPTKTRLAPLFALLLAALVVVPAPWAAAEKPKPAAKPAKPAKKQAAKPTKRRPNPAMQPITDDPKLPRVLLIGDSISIGYTMPVRELLAGKANVHRPRANCGPTTRGLEQIDAWLGEKPWDVIHFNWGLHDLKYMGPAGQNLADPKADTSQPQVPIDQYEQNLEKLVKRLQETGAKLVWCATTPVPKGAKGRVVGDSVRYNEAALRVMQKQGVAVDDLYAFAHSQLAKIQRKADVHFTPEGSRALAAEVAASVEEALAARTEKVE